MTPTTRLALLRKAAVTECDARTALVAVALKAAAPLIAAQARREAAEQIAAAITERRCSFRACNACLCRREDARAALDAFPKETPDA